MKRDLLLFIDDILDSIIRIEKFTKEISRDSFFKKKKS